MRWARRPLSLGDASEKLRRYSVVGSELDRDRITDYLDRSLMLVTALSPHVVYDTATAIAHEAESRRRHPHEAALALGLSEPDFARIVDPQTMVGQSRRDHGLENYSQ
jgi:fumarate hydratase, class II